MGIRVVGSCECCGNSGGSGSGGSGTGICCGLTPADVLVATFIAPGCPIYDGRTFFMPFRLPNLTFYGESGTPATCDFLSVTVQCNILTGAFTFGLSIAANPVCGLGQGITTLAFQCSPFLLVMQANCQYFAAFALCCDATAIPITVTVTKL